MKHTQIRIVYVEELNNLTCPLMKYISRALCQSLGLNNRTCGKPFFYDKARNKESACCKENEIREQHEKSE